MSLHNCSKCGELKAEVEFRVRLRCGKSYRLTECHSCELASKKVRRDTANYPISCETKVCKGQLCQGRSKPSSEFTPDRRGLDGLYSYCRDCASINALSHYHLRRQTKPKHHKLQQMLSNARNRAKADGVAFDLDIAYLSSLYSDRCACIGIGLDWMSEGSHSPNSPSLDKIWPEAGYVQGNVQIISRKANTMKNDANLSELKVFGEWCSMIYSSELAKIAAFYVNR